MDLGYVLKTKPMGGPEHWIRRIRETADPRVTQNVWPVQLALPFIKLENIIGISHMVT